MEVSYLLANGSVRGAGAEWQGAGNAQPGHGEVWIGAAKSWFSARPRGWTSFVVKRRKFQRNFAVNFSCLFCAYLTHKKIATEPPPQTSPRFCPKNLVHYGLLRERFKEVKPENSTGSKTGPDREVGERHGGCGIHRVRSGVSARSVSGASVESAWQLRWVSRHIF